MSGDAARLSAIAQDLYQSREVSDAAGWTAASALWEAAATITAQAQEIERLRAALEDAEDTLRLVEQPSFEDPRYGTAVRELGERIGYGALMSSASASWRKALAQTGITGGEFVAGPCHVTVVATLAKIRAAIRKETTA